MLKITLSTITAIILSMSNLNADTGTKDMHVVSKVEVYQENSYIETTGVYEEDEPIYSEPNPPMEYTEPPYSDSEIVKPTPSYNNTIIYAESARKYYRVGDAIKIRLKLKRKSHLYIWTVGRNGQGYMLLPNRFNGYNRFKSHYAYVFPERSLNFEFQSDRAGTEHLYILATNKPISTEKMEDIFNRRVGNYPTASARATKNFTTKDIHVIAKQEHLKYDIKHVTVQVIN